jgi:hypothetical protein
MSGLSTYLALAVALVLTSSVAGLWGPKRTGFRAARAIDVYGTEAATVPCPCCRALDWHNPAGGPLLNPGRR